MKAVTEEWVRRAEGDWNSLGREIRARKDRNDDAACFHAQQCAEKYLKARLVEAGLPLPKSHDLSDLLRLVLPVEPAWSALQDAADVLRQYGVEFRYPGSSADRAAAKEARSHCATVRVAVRLSLGLPL